MIKADNWYEGRRTTTCRRAVEVDLALNELRTNEPGSDLNEYVELAGAPERRWTTIRSSSETVLGRLRRRRNGAEPDRLRLSANGTLVIAEETHLGTADILTELNFENGVRSPACS